MTTLNIVFSGPPEQRHVAKPTPMTPLSAVLQEACSKMRPPLDPSQCQLIANKKPVDLGLPVRLANIPSGSKLELVKVTPQAAPAAPARPLPQAASAAPQHQQQPAAPAGDAGPSGASTSAAADDPLGLGRPLKVFTHTALEEAAAAAAPAARDAELPDEWFEMTADDFAKVRYQQNVRKKEAMVFRSRELREAEERSRAESFGPVPIRFHFHDGAILQSQFGALDEVAVLQEFVKRCLVPEAAKAFYLYTTPPRQKLKELEVSLYRAQLVPAANVHVHIDEDKLKEKGEVGCLLRAEVMALLQEHVPDLFPKPVQREQGVEPAGAEQRQEEERQAAAASAAASAGAAAASRTSATGQRVPKWMKL